MKFVTRKKLIATIASSTLLAWPVLVLADTGLWISGRATGQQELSNDLPTIIGTVIGILLGLVGVIFFILMVYGGILWMTSSGNDEQIGKARKILIQSVIGLAIVFTAYAVTTFVVGTVGLEDDGSWTIDRPEEGDWVMQDSEGNIIGGGRDLDALIGEESEESYDDFMGELGAE